MDISNSRIQTWRRCHYSHYLKYVMKLTRKQKGSALMRGSIIHECIEYYNSGRSWRKPFNKFKEEFYNTYFQEEIVDIGDLPKMVEALMENYQVYYEDEPYEYLENEKYFEIPLIKGCNLIGYIDAIVKDDKGAIWGKEIKTYSKTPDRDFLVMNNQSSIYLWALKQMGYPDPKGMLWDVVRAKEPTKPKLTAKTGKLSLAAIDSTPYTLEKGIRELGLDPSEYQDYIDSVRFDNYLYRYPIRTNPVVVDTIMEDTVSTAKEIMEKGEALKDRNLSKDCSWCSYKDICQAEMMGLDTSYIIKANYEYDKGGRKIEEEVKEKGSKKRDRGKNGRPGR